jgi:hypothetical protein
MMIAQRIDDRAKLVELERHVRCVGECGRILKTRHARVVVPR